MNMQIVTEGGSCLFEQNMLVYNKLAYTENPHEIQLNDAAIWVQVYNFPKGFMSENILKNVGDLYREVHQGRSCKL